MPDARQAVVDLIFGRWRSQILHAGVKLGIFESLAAGPRGAASIARDLSLDAAMAYRLLRGLACIGVLAEDSDRVFALTEAGAFLRKDHPQSLHGMTLLEEGPEHYAVWKHLTAIVRDGKQDGFLREYGHPIFEHTGADPAYAEVFNEAMTSYSTGETQLVLEALSGCDLSGIDHLCDVGGGHGHLLCGLLERMPKARGTVYDLPVTFAARERLWAARMGMADRCSYVPGDMFKSIPPAGAYVMKHILHDWNDDQCVRILKNVHAASPAHARVFVAEYVVPGPGMPHFAKLFDVHMMCATKGQERTEQEYAGLYRQAGWKLVTTWYPPSRLMGVVEAVKA